MTVRTMAHAAIIILIAQVTPSLIAMDNQDDPQLERLSALMDDLTKKDGPPGPEFIEHMNHLADDITKYIRRAHDAESRPGELWKETLARKRMLGCDVQRMHMHKKSSKKSDIQ